NVAERLGLLQLALPTSSGAFLCHYSPVPGILLAKTWLPAGGTGSRWDSVRLLIRETVEKFGGETELARLLGAGIKRSIAEEDCCVIDGLMSALSRVDWLKEQYLPRPDIVGDIWDTARRQASTTNSFAESK